MSDVNLATAAGTEQAVFTFSEDDLKKKKRKKSFYMPDKRVCFILMRCHGNV